MLKWADFFKVTSIWFVSCHFSGSNVERMSFKLYTIAVKHLLKESKMTSGTISDSHILTIIFTYDEKLKTLCPLWLIVCNLLLRLWCQNAEKNILFQVTTVAQWPATYKTESQCTQQGFSSWRWDEMWYLPFTLWTNFMKADTCSMHVSTCEWWYIKILL